jgi:hypothetical protein
VVDGVVGARVLEEEVRDLGLVVGVLGGDEGVLVGLDALVVAGLELGVVRRFGG